MYYLSNAFSIQMLEISFKTTVIFKRLTHAEVLDILEKQQWTSAIGHPDFARVLSKEFGKEIPYNRRSITLQSQDTLLIAQYMGGRLPEGATELPKDAIVQYFTAKQEVNY